MSGAAQAAVQEVAGDWTFRAADTKQITHGIHAYPAMMIPQIAQRLIQTYGRKGAFLFDPYCGSGTTLLEGMLAGAKTAGTDLNPLARLIARVKTTPVNMIALDQAITQFPNTASRGDFAVPNIPNIDYWFSSEAQRDLAAIREYINNISDNSIANVFRVAFSLTVRKTSWTRKSEFKLYRMTKRQIDNHCPDPFALMRQFLLEMRRSLQALNGVVSNNVSLPKIYKFNTVIKVPAKIPPVNLVITSPPYGDSRTTVAYGQFCRLSSQWLGYAEASHVDNMLMGGDKVKSLPIFRVEELDRVIAGIAKIHQVRAREVAAFFADYRSSISNVARAMAIGGYACYVVGNRTVKKHTVPTAEATAAFFKENGFEIVGVGQRDIPNKRMPAVNSPSNVPGKVGRTMTAEQIVICRKAG